MFMEYTSMHVLSLVNEVIEKCCVHAIILIENYQNYKVLNQNESENLKINIANYNTVIHTGNNFIRLSLINNVKNVLENGCPSASSKIHIKSCESKTLILIRLISISVYFIDSTLGKMN